MFPDRPFFCRAVRLTLSFASTCNCACFSSVSAEVISFAAAVNLAFISASLAPKKVFAPSMAVLIFSSAVLAAGSLVRG
jgi:hypothetical protein